MFWKAILLGSIAGFSAFSEAISLADFKPQDVNLPPACNSAYTTQIAGCQVSDFQSGRSCSSACLSGLVQINALMTNACQNADVPETSMVGLFKLGKGIEVLCNIAVVTKTTGGPSQQTTIPIGQSTMILSSMAPIGGGLLTDTSPFPQATSQPTPRFSSIQSMQSIGSILPNPSTPLAMTSTTVNINTSHISSTASGTNNGRDSATQLPEGPQGGRTGGGSPFDITGNGSASSFQQRLGSVLAALLGVSLVMTLLS